MLKQVWLTVLFLSAATVCWSQSQAPVIETIAPDLNVILQSIEHAQQQNRAQFRPYQVIRQYKVFRADDKRPISEVTAQINFTPPDMKTCKIRRQVVIRVEKRRLIIQQNTLVLVQHDMLALARHKKLAFADQRRQLWLRRTKNWLNRSQSCVTCRRVVVACFAQTT